MKQKLHRTGTPRATRDEWLAGAITELRDDFKGVGYPIPKVVRASIGFPSHGARPGRNHTIGQCWTPSAIADNITQVYVSPVLADPIRILGVLTHELVHAAVGCECGHKGAFRKCALAVGLEGKMTATSEGPALVKRLRAIARGLGKLPHAALDPSVRKKQTTRMLKVACPYQGCQFKVRMTRMIIDVYGTPECPTCGLTCEESV